MLTQPAGRAAAPAILYDHGHNAGTFAADRTDGRRPVLRRIDGMTRRQPVPLRSRNDPPAAPTTYQLIVEVARALTVSVGRLGIFRFPAGTYVYTGSAKRNIEARIARHLSSAKRLHWHIDYLLAAPGVSVLRVRRSRRPECELNLATRGETPVPGFGASDCRAGCGSHLKRRGSSPARPENPSASDPKSPRKAAR